MKIVFADDDEAYRSLLRTAFSMLPGVAVVGEAANGQDAVALARCGCADAFLLDVEMPVMDGFAAALEIRKLCPGARVTLHTAHLAEERRAWARRLDLPLLDKLRVYETVDFVASG